VTAVASSKTSPESVAEQLGRAVKELVPIAPLEALS